MKTWFKWWYVSGLGFNSILVYFTCIFIYFYNFPIFFLSSNIPTPVPNLATYSEPLRYVSVGEGHTAVLDAHGKVRQFTMYFSKERICLLVNNRMLKYDIPDLNDRKWKTW